MSHNKETEGTVWMHTLWRPCMGWLYMLICLLDMAVFPVLWALWQGYEHQQITQWNPLTLQGAGLFHIAMGAVLGIAAFGRTQEKLAGTAVNPMATTSNQNINMQGNTAGGYGSVGAGGMNVNNGMMGGGMNSSMGGSFGTPSPSSFGAPVTPPAFSAPPVTPPTSSKSTIPTSGFPPL
jgi:hypothetical protein